MSNNIYKSFSTTSSTSSPNPSVTQSKSQRSGRKKRTQVTRACDWCRVHRVKCDNDRPCKNCTSRGKLCSNAGSTQSTLPQAYREIESLRQKVEELESELQQRRNANNTFATHGPQTPPSLVSPAAIDQYPAYTDLNPHRAANGPAKKLWEGILISTERSPQQTWYGPSSVVYFIGCINTFLTSALKRRHSTHEILLKSTSNLLGGPSALYEDDHQPIRPVTSADDPIIVGEYLTATQEEYFLNLFWQSYYHSFPILHETDFKEHYQSLWVTPGGERKPSALVDVIIALCMQYGMAQISCPEQHKAPSKNNLCNYDATIAGRWYYRRCQTLLVAELESPSISTLQCQILCCVYLCCGSLQNMADNACSLAVRTAFMLGLHLEPPQGLPRRERELRKRLWWTLYTLEAKMSMKLGRPFLVHENSYTCSFPADDRETAMLSESSFAPLEDNATWLSWCLHHTKLFLAARAAYAPVQDHTPDSSSVCNSEPVSMIMDEWVNGVPEALKTKRQNNGMPFSTDQSPLDIEGFTPVWLQRQRLLLELLYHNLCTNLYRPSIVFALTQEPRLLAESTAMICAGHAMALTHIMHHVLLSTSILAGWYESFHWQWNASMTLVGFILAYPQGTLTPAARRAIDLSVDVFRYFGDSFAIAANAATIMCDLSAKVDVVIEQSRSEHGDIKSQQQRNFNPTTEKWNLRFPTYKESSNNMLLSDDFTAVESMKNTQSFDGQATAELRGVLADSIDIFAETYNNFEWSSSYWDFPDKRIFMPQ